MVAKFTRTLSTTTAIVKFIDKDTLYVGEKNMVLPDYTDNCDKALKICQKIQYAEDPKVVILNVIGLTQNTAKYEMTLDTFLKYATKVEE